MSDENNTVTGLPAPELPAQIVTTCALLGIDPPRRITQADIKKAYPGMPLIQQGIWNNIKAIQGE